MCVKFSGKRCIQRASKYGIRLQGESEEDGCMCRPPSDQHLQQKKKLKINMAYILYNATKKRIAVYLLPVYGYQKEISIKRQMQVPPVAIHNATSWEKSSNLRTILFMHFVVSFKQLMLHKQGAPQRGMRGNKHVNGVFPSAASRPAHTSPFSRVECVAFFFKTA